MSIEANILGREQATLIVDLLQESASRLPPDALPAFWDKIVSNVPGKWLPEKIVERGPTAKMTDDDAARFGKSEVMQFGKFQGKYVNDVPLDYLEWLDDQPDFRRQLNRYLRSDCVQREIDSRQAGGKGGEK